MTRARIASRVQHATGELRFAPRGQGLVEYGLILAVAAIVALVALLVFGDQISAFVSALANAA